MKYKIIADSCCDYPEGRDDFGWIMRIPLTILIDGQKYIDDGSMGTEELLRLIESSTESIGSACPSPGDFIEAIKGEEDDVYIVTLSKNISGTYESAQTAVSVLKEEGNEKNIHVFDTRSASAGEVAVSMKIHELAESGMPFSEVVEQVEQYINGNKIFFVLETLDVLRKNGRLTNLQAAITSALQIKLVMTGRPDGTIGLMSKALSIKSALGKMIDHAQKGIDQRNAAEKRLVISHCGSLERAKTVRDSLLERIKFKEVILCRTGGLSTIYANRGGIVLSY